MPWKEILVFDKEMKNPLPEGNTRLLELEMENKSRMDKTLRLYIDSGTGIGILSQGVKEGGMKYHHILNYSRRWFTTLLRNSWLSRCRKAKAYN